MTRYRVARQTASWSRFAAATVEVVPSAQRTVDLASTVTDPARRREAELGAWRALGALPASSAPHRVLVTDVVTTEVDTGVGDIHEATAHAVWQALDVRPTPPYVGISEPELVTGLLRERIGLRVQTVTEARHWHGGHREPNSGSLIHAWLQFERRSPVRLHGCGDELLLSAEDPYPSYDMAEHGEIRVGPAQAPDLLAGAVGARLTDAAVILHPFDSPSCAGLILRLDATDVIIGTLCDEWILATGQVPAAATPWWTVQPFVHSS